MQIKDRNGQTVLHLEARDHNELGRARAILAAIAKHAEADDQKAARVIIVGLDVLEAKFTKPTKASAP